ncbi:MAG: hypothetical protein ABIZ04_04365 [Opitutus sp.]
MTPSPLTAPTANSTAVSEELPPSAPVAYRSASKSSDVLGFAWLHGTLHAEVFRRHETVATWASPISVDTLDQFERALDEALHATAFSGTDVFMVLEHEQFVHQVELVPAFSDSAARTYLRGRVQRYEQSREPVLWVGQKTVSVKKESGYLLHLLPTAFHTRLSSFFRARRLDLTRVVPLVVPLQLERHGATSPRDEMIMIAAEAGAATTLMVVRADGELLFSRTMLARWETDAIRIATEVNRSLLYAKQQFGAIVKRVELFGEVSAPAHAEVQARCGAEKEVLSRPVHIPSWLQAVVRLSPRHPVNLVIGHLGRKRRRQFLRRLLIAVCWLGLGLMALDCWNETKTWDENEHALVRLRARAPELRMQRETLTARNQEVARHREFVRVASAERLPNAPVSLLTFLARIRTPDTQFTDYLTKWDAETGKWSFRVEGVIEGDEETARESLTRLERGLEKSALRARLKDGGRVLVQLPAATADATPTHRFIMEGGLLED